MVGELLTEIMDAIGAPVFRFDLGETVARLVNCLAQERYFVFIARDEAASALGFVALYEGDAL